nr:hypothetical protein [Tanacetum cinerariifolium]
MSNTNDNVQTQISSAPHNAIMEAGGKDHPPMLAPVDACQNAIEMWKAIERLKQSESINVQDLETNMYWEFRKLPYRKEKEIDKLMALISMSFKKIYKPTNNNLTTSSNTINTNVDNTLRSNSGTGYDRQTRQDNNKRAVNVAGARENVGT